MTTPAFAENSAIRYRPLWWSMGLLAVLFPTLLAAHEPPSVTFYNQALAVLGWGLFVAVLGSQPRVRAQGPAGLAMMALSGVLGVVAIEAFGSAFAWGQLPAGLGLMGGGMSLAAALALWAGWRSGRGAQREDLQEVFFGALTAAGCAGMVLGLIQAFHPAWTDGIFIAEPTVPGRAVGNLRQPNHFSTLLVFACCGVAWMGARGRVLSAWVASLLMALFIGGIVLTASRTGMIGMAILTLWGVMDKRLPRVLRWTLIGAPVIYGLLWGGMWLWAHADQSVKFAAEARLHDKSDISSSRFKIWANVLDLIRAHPWLGVGYGEFNVAWTLSPFPTRPIAFFDHTHDLPLQWAVEFGLPITTLLLALSAWGLWQLAKGLFVRMKAAADDADASAFSTVGASSVMVAIAAVHSLLEYPLWYSYFLLPTAFAWGLGLAARAQQDATPAISRHGGHGMVAGGILMAVLAIWCAADYQAAVNIYAPRAGAGPLDKRIAFGKKMPWWGYQADYADVTSLDDEDPSKPPADFKRTLHNLLDARLMAAYARSLAEHGEVDKARFVVQRLKEFRNPIGDEFLSVCKAQPEPGEEHPFQCAPPAKSYSWRELLPS